MKTLIIGMYRTTHKNNSVIYTGVVGLASPAARTINYHLTTLLNYHTINLPTRRQNLDSTLKCSYPFVTPSIGYM